MHLPQPQSPQPGQPTRPPAAAKPSGIGLVFGIIGIVLGLAFVSCLFLPVAIGGGDALNIFQLMGSFLLVIVALLFGSAGLLFALASGLGMRLKFMRFAALILGVGNALLGVLGFALIMWMTTESGQSIAIGSYLVAIIGVACAVNGALQAFLGGKRAPQGANANFG